jgi:hypothetical protein
VEPAYKPDWNPAIAFTCKKSASDELEVATKMLVSRTQTTSLRRSKRCAAKLPHRFLSYTVQGVGTLVAVGGPTPSAADFASGRFLQISRTPSGRIPAPAGSEAQSATRISSWLNCDRFVSLHGMTMNPYPRSFTPVVVHTVDRARGFTRFDQQWGRPLFLPPSLPDTPITNLELNPPIFRATGTDRRRCAGR